MNYEKRKELNWPWLTSTFNFHYVFQSLYNTVTTDIHNATHFGPVSLFDL